jgi:GAF domain
MTFSIFRFVKGVKNMKNSPLFTWLSHIRDHVVAIHVAHGIEFLIVYASAGSAVFLRLTSQIFTNPVEVGFLTVVLVLILFLFLSSLRNLNISNNAEADDTQPTAQKTFATRIGALAVVPILVLVFSGMFKGKHHSDKHSSWERFSELISEHMSCVEGTVEAFRDVGLNVASLMKSESGVEVRAEFYVCSPDKERLHAVRDASLGFTTAFNTREFDLHSGDKNDRGLAGYVAIHCEELNISDVDAISADEPFAFKQFYDLNEELVGRTRSIVLVPVCNQKNKSKSKEVIGVIAFSSPMPNAFDDDEIAKARIVAGSIRKNMLWYQNQVYSNSESTDKDELCRCQTRSDFEFADVSISPILRTDGQAIESGGEATVFLIRRIWATIIGTYFNHVPHGC